MGNLWIVTEKRQFESEKLLSWEARESPFSAGIQKSSSQNLLFSPGMRLSMGQEVDTHVAGHW